MGSGYFFNILSYFKENILSVAELTNSANSHKKVEETLKDCIENIYYFNDIFELNNENLTSKFSDIVLHHFIIPVLLSSLIEIDSNINEVYKNVALYILAQLILHLTSKSIVSQIQSFLFSDKVPQYLCELLKSPPIRCSSSIKTNKILIKNPVSLTIFNILSHNEESTLCLCLYLIHVSFTQSYQNFLTCTDKSNQVFFEKIVDTLSHILVSQDHHRFTSFFFAGKLIFDLSAAKDIASEYHREQEIIKFALQKRGINLVKIVDKTKNKLEFIRSFEKQWEYVQNLSWIENLELPAKFIFAEDGKTNDGSLNAFKETEIFDNEIRIFLFLRKLKFLIIRCEVPEMLDPFENPLKILNRCNLVVGKSYYLNTGFLKGKNEYEVREKGKKIIVDDNWFFILGEKSNAGKCLTIQIVVRFSYLRVVESDNDRTITLLRENSNPISFYVEDYFLCTDLKSSIKSRISACIDIDLSLLKSFIHDTR